MKAITWQKRNIDAKKIFVTILFVLILVLGVFNHLHTFKIDMGQILNSSSNLHKVPIENEVISGFPIHTTVDSDPTASQFNTGVTNTNSKRTGISEFPVTLTGRYSDVGVDTDENLLFNIIRIKIEVNSTQLISCFIILDLLWDFGYTQSFPHQTITLNPGIQNLTYEFNPRDNYYSIDNTSFDIQYLSLKYYTGGDGSFLEAHSIYDSREYHYTEFDQPDAYFTGLYSTSDIDSDGDGLINLLRINTEINFTKRGDFTVSLHFAGKESNFDIWESLEEYFDPGITVVNFTFNLGDLHSRKVNTSYEVKYMDIYYQNYRVYFAPDSISTRYYQYTEFDPPSAYLTLNFNDQGLDTDADGLFNYLSIMVQMNVTVEGYYKVSVHLISKDSDAYVEWGEIDQEWTKGVHNIHINFEIVQNYSQPWTNSFSLFNIRIQDQLQMQIIVEELFLYTTAIYQSSSFDPPVVIVTGNFWDRGFDTDEDGNFNFLEILAEINVTEEIIDYSFLLTLSDPRDVLVSVLEQHSLDIGFHIISFYLDSPSLLYSFYDPGSLSVVFEVTLIRVYDSDMVITLEKETEFVTSEYYFSSFDPPESIILPSTTENSTPTSPPDKSLFPIDVRFILFGVILILLLFTLKNSRK